MVVNGNKKKAPPPCWMQGFHEFEMVVGLVSWFGNPALLAEKWLRNVEGDDDDKNTVSSIGSSPGDPPPGGGAGGGARPLIQPRH